MSANLTDKIAMRLRIPSTPSELSAIMRVPIRTVRATLYLLRKAGRVKRLDRCIKNQPGKGRKEYFWWASR